METSPIRASVLQHRQSQRLNHDICGETLIQLLSADDKQDGDEALQQQDIPFYVYNNHFK